MAETRAAQEDWRQLAAMWWVSQTSEQTPLVKPKKIHRLKARAWLWATHKMLETLTGRGWPHWTQPTDKTLRGDPRTWPLIAIVIDQGSDVWCAAHWLCETWAATR